MEIFQLDILIIHRAFPFITDNIFITLLSQAYYIHIKGKKAILNIVCMRVPRCLASLQCGAAAGPPLGEIGSPSWPGVGVLSRYQLETWRLVPRWQPFEVGLAVALLVEAQSWCKSK